MVSERNVHQSAGLPKNLVASEKLILLDRWHGNVNLSSISQKFISPHIDKHRRREISAMFILPHRKQSLHQAHPISSRNPSCSFKAYIRLIKASALIFLFLDVALECQREPMLKSSHSCMGISLNFNVRIPCCRAQLTARSSHQRVFSWHLKQFLC